MKFFAATLFTICMAFGLSAQAADLSMLADFAVDDIHTEMLGLDTP